ncbi:MAG TPA: serine protease [Cyanothece sp. UBA12306]|nr:serine protease [Cyanothece sp. UBA12306]
MKQLLRSIILVSSLFTVNQPVVSQPNFKQEVLSAHNKYRQEVDVPSLKWSDRLANQAQQWADYLASLGGNQLQHDPNLSGQGENLWLGPSNRLSYTQMVDRWGREKQYFIPGLFNPNKISSTGNWSDVGHYTQIIWKNTTKLGCAISKTEKNDILICRYSPQGNIIGQPVY